jgi:hypothetical protein
MRSAFIFALPMAAVLLTACAGGGSAGGGGGGSGGGGGGGGGSNTPVPFTSFSAVQFGQPVQATGMSQTVSATTNPVLGSLNVTSTTVNPVDTASSGAQLTYGVPPPITAFSFSTPQSSIAFSGINVQCTLGTGACRGSNFTTMAVVVNPLDPPNPTLAWNYQSFGYWLVTPSVSTALAGAISFGNVTPVTGIPKSGPAATYNGLSSGTYVDPSGAVFEHAAQMTSTVNFNARSVAFSTTGTTISPLNVASPVSAFALNLSGTLTYGAGSNQFSGPVTTPGGTVNSVVTPAMTGTATGRFYGPTAQEIGGVFSLKATTNPGTSPQTMLGGFGGKR